MVSRKKFVWILLASLCTIIINDGLCNTINDRKRFFTKERIQMAIKFLGKYGYIDKDHIVRGNDQEHMQEDFLDGLKRFQYFSSLKVTGVVDDETTKLMKTGRCGVEDPPVVLPGERQKRYRIQGSRWRKKTIVWKLKEKARTLTTEEVKGAIKVATDLWSKASNMNFREAKGNEYVDMWIRFASGYHGDPRAFDGPNGTLGHAFYPVVSYGLSGDVHFDNDEHFVYQTKDGYDIVQAMIHEMGHALGLQHSQVKEAIMFPFQETGKYMPNIKLHNDDIRGLQRLYGRPKPRTQPPTKPPTRPPTTTTTTTTTTLAPTTLAPKIILPPCPTSSVDAVYFFPSYKLYVAITMSRQVYFIANHGKIRSGPKRVEKYFSADKLKGRIDASFATKKINPNYHLTVLFSKKSYYLYNGFGYFSGPHSIHSRFEKDGRTKTPLEMVLPPWVRKVDAVLPKRNGDFYLFSGQWFWEYSFREKRFRRGYPQYIRNAWPGLPKSIHAAFLLPDGSQFALHKNKFYKLEKGRVSKGFPHPFHKWIQCTPK